MSCSRILEELGALLDGDIPVSVQREIEDHLRTCRNCGVLVQTCRRTILIYRQDQPPPLPAALHSRIMAKLTDRTAGRA